MMRCTVCLLTLFVTESCTGFTSPRLVMNSRTTNTNHPNNGMKNFPTTTTTTTTTTITSLQSLQNNNEKEVNDKTSSSLTVDSNARRGALLTLASATVLLPLVSANAATTTTTTTTPLETLSLGQGQWTPQLDNNNNMNMNKNGMIPQSFCTYASRFLIKYDEGVQTWWKTQESQYSLLSSDKRQVKLEQSFVSFAKSLELALQDYMMMMTTTHTPTNGNNNNNNNKNDAAAYDKLWDIFYSKYVVTTNADSKDIQRQLGILFTMLPPQDQPVSKLRSITSSGSSSSSGSSPTTTFDMDNFRTDFNQLLPSSYHCVEQQPPQLQPQTTSPTTNAGFFSIEPAIVNLDTLMGPSLQGEQPLGRPVPQLSPSIYALLGVSGSAACAATHSVVIPLDVVKTRAQTDPAQYSNTWQGIQTVLQGEEGLAGLYLGAQATLVGYLWYGISIYPSYSFLKRYATTELLSPAVATVHMNDIALIAGAMSAVVASIGLTPLEAARIRVVADPITYKSLGLLGTMASIAKEDTALGWKTLYASFPSLLTRQVIFGSVKFIAFERTCEAIFAELPFLRDATWTTLGVSLVAGGVSGVLAAIVSQPADSVLTYVAKSNSKDFEKEEEEMNISSSSSSSSSGTTTTTGAALGVLEGSRIMIEKEGWSSLFLGLGSRCVWSGCIIAGQFLLYDVFRTTFGVNNDALSQIYQIQLN